MQSVGSGATTKGVQKCFCQDLKVIPLKLAQHIIEMDITIPLAHQAKYILNPNYAIVVN
jgi:hypothetical protein